MKISLKDWIRYRDKLSRINKKAEEEFVAWINSMGGYEAIEGNLVVEYAYGLATKYGEASASLSALMYDATAELSKAIVPVAEVAETATYKEVARAIYGAAKTSTESEYLGSVVNRLVKQAGADTTLKNAKRDGAQFAWVPAGETCAFCITLASNGWQNMSKSALEGNHASHIHPNCDCTYAVRFDNKTSVAGYNPNVYKRIYYSAEGSTPSAKINSIRRELYEENKDEINAQKRANYAENKEN